jgi:hypothetical protein
VKIKMGSEGGRGRIGFLRRGDERCFGGRRGLRGLGRFGGIPTWFGDSSLVGRWSCVFLLFLLFL